MENGGCRAILITADGNIVQTQVGIELNAINNSSQVAAHSDKVFVVNTQTHRLAFSPIRHVVIENAKNKNKKDLLVCEYLKLKGDTFNVTHTLHIADEHNMASIFITVSIPCLLVKFNAKVLLPLKLSSNTLDSVKQKMQSMT